MAKLKTDRGYRFVNELGGAVRRSTVSFGAKWLVANQRVIGRVLDYGCGFGFDADHFGWEAFDPHYRQLRPTGKYDTIICNHVLNMLTRKSRLAAIETIQHLLTNKGTAWLIVPRNIPQSERLAFANEYKTTFVWIVRPSIGMDSLEIYRMSRYAVVTDTTNEIEWRLQRN
jgi:hypothetical protein